MKIAISFPVIIEIEQFYANCLLACWKELFILAFNFV